MIIYLQNNCVSRAIPADVVSAAEEVTQVDFYLSAFLDTFCSNMVAVKETTECGEKMRKPKGG